MGKVKAMTIHVLCHNGRAQKTVQYGFNLQEAVDNYGKCKTDWQATTADMYACGFLPPNHSMPAIPMQIERMTDGWPILVEIYNGSSVTIMHIGNADDLCNW